MLNKLKILKLLTSLTLLVFSFPIQTKVFSSNIQNANTIFNHLDQKFQNLDLSQQQKEREKTKQLFYQVKRKATNDSLLELVNILIERSEWKILALQDYQKLYSGDYIIEITLESWVKILTSDPESIVRFPNSKRIIKEKLLNDINQIRLDMLDSINSYRAEFWLWKLKLNTQLNLAAQRHAEYMSKTKDFGHTTKAWLKFNVRIQRAGYKWSFIWENIAYNQRSIKQVMDDWIASTWHRANILNKEFKEIGIGFSNYYWVQNFWTK